MKNNQIYRSLLLFLTAIIWGTAFVAQSEGMDHVGPITFNGIRSLLGGIALIPCVIAVDLIEKKKMREGKIPTPSAEQKAKTRKNLLIGGVVCGLIIFAASTSQQIGLIFTSAGKAGFITACYIVLVPIFGLFIKRKCSPSIAVAVVLAVIGLYLLCMTGDFSITLGDGLILLCAMLFAIHILTVDHFSPLVSGVKLSCIQFLVCGLVSLVFMFIFEEPSIEGLSAVAFPIFYAGVMSCGVAYTLQIIGQKGTNPTVASLIMSLESCVAVIAAWIIQGDTLTEREISGCLVMFAAIILAQFPLETMFKRKKK